MTNSVSTWQMIKNDWLKSFVAMAIALALIVLSYYQTIYTMVSLWIDSDTFTHGFMILPISIWLVWEYRERLQGLKPSADWLYVWLIPTFGLIWYIGDIASIQFVKQFAVVAMFSSFLATILGRDVVRAVWFPLVFLLFMVPAAGWLVPPMMEFTATFTVEMVRLSGIPVYRDGLSFSLPTGSWSVIQACSGVRYIIASVTLGVLFAYMTYTKVHKQILFIIASILLPIVANAIRAYMIVMIGHMSGMELATGVDHLFYGWVFFGLIMGILFFVGARWRDKEEEFVPTSMMSAKNYSSFKIYLVSIVLVVIWPILVFLGVSNLNNPIDFSTDVKAAQWQPTKFSANEWKVVAPGTPVLIYKAYSDNGRVINQTTVAYKNETQGSELVSILQRPANLFSS